MQQPITVLKYIPELIIECAYGTMMRVFKSLRANQNGQIKPYALLQ